MVKDQKVTMISEAARRAEVSEDTMRRAFDRGELAGFRTSGGVRLIYQSALDAFVRERSSRKKQA